MKLNSKHDYDKIHVKVPSNLLEIMNSPKKDSSKSQVLNTYLDIISKKSKVSPFFLPAYNKIAEKEIRRINSQEQKNRLTKTFHYMHPGTYREFIFTENETIYKDENNPSKFLFHLEVLKTIKTISLLTLNSIIEITIIKIGAKITQTKILVQIPLNIKLP